jgi:hypothetical protein
VACCRVNFPFTFSVLNLKFVASGRTSNIKIFSYSPSLYCHHVTYVMCALAKALRTLFTLLMFLVYNFYHSNFIFLNKWLFVSKCRLQQFPLYLYTWIIHATIFLIIIISYGVKFTWYSMFNVLPLVSSDFCAILYNCVFKTPAGWLRISEVSERGSSTFKITYYPKICCPDAWRK